MVMCRQVSALMRWLFLIYRSYNRVPFHNFKHAFMVTQMVRTLLHAWCPHDALFLCSVSYRVRDNYNL